MNLDTRQISFQSAVKHRLDNNVTLGGRVNQDGIWDLSFTAKLTDQLTATFTHGGTSKGVFDQKTGDESYSGLTFKFNL